MRVLFICSHNIARSQMAEAMVNHLFGDRWEACSAGIHPGSAVNPYMKRAMAETGIDMAAARPRAVSELEGRCFDYVVTLCDAAKEGCPTAGGPSIRMHKSFPNPSEFVGDDEEQMAQARALRDDMKRWIEATFVAMPSECA